MILGRLGSRVGGRPIQHSRTDKTYENADRCGRGLAKISAEKMAEEEGFEPPIPFQVRQFSRLEPSTTRPLFLLEG
jgi:hypothetical protein